VGEDVVERIVDKVVGAAFVQRRCSGAGQELGLSGWGGTEHVEQRQNVVEAVDSSAVTDREQLRGGSRGCWSGELDAAGGAFKKGVEGSQLGQQLLAITDPLRVELEDDVPVGDVLGVADIADPVVRLVRADQDEVSGREAADVVSDDGPAGPVLDQVDLELGMVVPAAVWAGVVVGVPAGRCARHDRHEFAGGGLSEESAGLND
jgi:hypothetical protein